jgi:hypothetical protein
MGYRGETPSAPSVTTGSCLEYTFSGGYAKNPRNAQPKRSELPRKNEAARNAHQVGHEQSQGFR